MCSGVFFTGAEEDQAEQRDQGRMHEVLGDQDMEEKLICFNRCLYLVTKNPKKNVWHLGFVFLAELALLSDDYIETYEHSCRCYVLPELHKITSVPLDFPMPRMQQREAETSNTQSITTSTLHVQPRSGSRCVRDR